jgi:hypothetical protein
VTYETNTYPGGRTTVSAPIPPNRPGTVLTREGIKGAKDDHDEVRQSPGTGITPTQTPTKPKEPAPTKPPNPDKKRSPWKWDTSDPNIGTVTITAPVLPLQDPSPIKRPTPLKPQPPNPVPIKRNNDGSASTSSPDQSPIKDLKNPDPDPVVENPFPVFSLASKALPVAKIAPFPPITDALRADPVTGNPVKTKPTTERPKAPPPIGNPGSGGSTCAWPADRGTVLGNQGTIQTTQATHSTIMDGIVNIHIKSVSDKVTNAKELLDKIVRSDVVDRAINLLTLASAIHNSVMLSRELGSTLTEALSNILSAVGIKDAEGNAFDLSAVFGKQLESLIKAIIGEENYTTYKAIWIKSNRILTTASNLLDSIKSQHSAIMQGVEVVANVTSELSNAAKSEGLFNDDLLDFQPNNHDFNTPFSKSQQILQNLNEAGEQINQLASAVIEGQEASAEISKNWSEMNTAIADAKTIKRDLETIKDGQNIPPDSELLDFVRHQAED